MTLNIRFLMIIALAILVSSCASRQQEKNEKQAEILMGAGTQALMEKNYTEALNSLLKANELRPNDTEILNNLGMAFYFKGSVDMAIKHLNASLAANDRNGDAKTNLGSIYYALGKVGEAEKIYLNLLKDLTYTKQGRTYYNLGMIEMVNRKNFAKAESYFKRSLVEDENYCSAHFQLGYLNFKSGKFNRATQNFRDATLGICGKNPVAHYYQGLTYVELRRYDDARMKFAEVETQFRSSPYAAEARRKMAQLTHMRNEAPSSFQTSRKTFESPEF